jgi:hypothetical protein
VSKALWPVLVLVLFLAGTAGADDLTPPPWDRYGAGTTYQKWEFSDPGNLWAPTEVFNPYGDPFLSVFQYSWFDEYAGRTGIMEGLAYYFWIPNNPDPNMYKDIWLQYVYNSDGGVPEIDIQPGDWEVLDNSLMNDLGNGWYYEWWHIRLYPNPPYEGVWIVGQGCMDVITDQVVIDTICVPEPVTISLFGLGVAVFAFRRRC